MITVGAMALEESVEDRPDLGSVTLREEAGERALPIMMLRSQLAAIADADRETEVPMTHDLLRSVLETLSGRLVAVVITELRGGTFHAALEIEQGAKRHRVPARPSDALALAARVTGTPVLIEDAVFEAWSESKRRPGAIRLLCPNCRAGKVFEMIRDEGLLRVRDKESSTEFRLPGVVEWVCSSCGHQHQSQVTPPPWVASA